MIKNAIILEGVFRIKLTDESHHVTATDADFNLDTCDCCSLVWYAYELKYVNGYMVCPLDNAHSA